jgi:OmpA-OmpF porin, OOP family
MSLRSRWTPLLPILAASMTLSSAALAQNAKSGEFSVQKFAPAPGPRNFITVEGARTDGHWTWSGGVFINYAANPFTLRSCVSKTNCDSANAVNKNDIHIVETMVTGDALASLTPIPRLQIGLRVPVTYVRGDGVDPNTGLAAKGGLSATGLGDPMLEAKVRAFGAVTDPFVLGAAVFATGPAGRATAKDKFIGDKSPVVGLRGIFDGNAGPISFGFNLAGLYRQESKLGSTELGSAFRYGVGVGYKISPVIRGIAEGYGETKFSSKAGTNSLEALGAVQINPLASPINVYAGAGGGVIQGVGVPQVRAFVGFMYVHEVMDSDGDGLADDVDKCPTDPEDSDGYQDEDGCPDPDNDGDAVPDTADKCPNKPETENGFQDEDGCPDELPDRDNDGVTDTEDQCPDDGGPTVIRAKGKNYGCPDRDKDGVPDKIDQCPDEMEDTDGFKDEDGCPDPDNDNDGVLDGEDECVDQPGTKENHGCPDPDSDGDGIPDSKDKCKDKPETYNGFEDGDGCPDKAPQSLIEVTDEGIKIKEQVQFATGSDKIVGAKSFKILDQVASVLVANQAINQLEVGGHTDNVGGAEGNKSLSQKRADAVKKYLVEKGGVPDRKLTAVGYGQEKPIADNATPKGKQANRRVEFNIIKLPKKKPAAPAEP